MKNLPLTCVWRFHATISSNNLDTLDVLGVAKRGAVYVPIPAYRDRERVDLQQSKRMSGCVPGSTPFAVSCRLSST